MSNELITVATFMSNSEAGPARSLLEATGIRTYVQGGTTADILSHVGTALGGVKLQVAAGDSERAAELLGQNAADGASAPHNAWECHQCGESVDAGFEVCWSCGAEYSESASPAAVHSRSVEPDQTDSPEVRQAVRCPMCGQRFAAGRESCPHCGESFIDDAERGRRNRNEDVIPDHVQFARDHLGRAFRASLIGTVLCPPLVTCYSLFQLVEYEHMRRELRIASDWRLPAAYLINSIVILYALGFILMIVG